MVLGGVHNEFHRCRLEKSNIFFMHKNVKIIFCVFCVRPKCKHLKSRFGVGLGREGCLKLFLVGKYFLPPLMLATLSVWDIRMTFDNISVNVCGNCFHKL